MTGDPHVERLRRARPVADAPVDALLARAEELARSWAIALLLARPLPEMAEVPLEHIARDAPAICAQVIRALDSDAELERLIAGARATDPDGAARFRLRAEPQAPDPSSTVSEVEALRGVLWEALLEELKRPMRDRASAVLVAELSDRLAHVCAATLAAMLSRPTSTSTSISASASAEAPRVARRAPGEALTPRPTLASEERSRAVLVDELLDSSPAQRSSASSAEPARPALAQSLPGGRPPAPSEVRRRSEASEEQAAQPRPRARPWDWPASAERPERRSPRRSTEASGASPTDVDADGGVVSVRRGPARAADERE